MYQYQRQQIKKRMEEKEQQLVTVSKEREDLKAKLSQLQTLVTHFMAEKGLASNASPQQTQIAVAQAVASTAATAAGDANGGKGLSKIFTDILTAALKMFSS